VRDAWGCSVSASPEVGKLGVDLQLPEHSGRRSCDGRESVCRTSTRDTDLRRQDESGEGALVAIGWGVGLGCRAGQWACPCPSPSQCMASCCRWLEGERSRVRTSRPLRVSVATRGHPKLRDDAPLVPEESERHVCEELACDTHTHALCSARPMRCGLHCCRMDRMHAQSCLTQCP